MKKQLFLFFLLLSIIQSGMAQSPLDQRLDFAIDQLTIPEALRALATQSNFNIVFSDNFFNRKKRYSHNFRQQKLATILEQLLRPAPVEFALIGQQIIINKKALPPPRYTISGYIQTAEDGEKLIAATLYSPQHQAGTITNEYGFFSLQLPQGKTQLVASYLGTKERKIPIDLTANQNLVIDLEQLITLAEVEVRPEHEGSRQLFGGSPSASELAIGQLDRAPDLGGEADLLRAALLLPGVQSGADGLGGLHIRGGNADQNLLLLDGVPIYNPNHLLGIFSIFNTDAIRDAKLLKGNFSAHYGGRLSSIFDVRTREGNEKEWSGDLGLGLVSLKSTIEGPLFNKRGALLLSVRRTHFPIFLEENIRNIFYPSKEGDLSFRFVDANAKINFKLSPRNRIFLSWYQGGDTFQTYEEETTLEDGLRFTEAYENNLRWGNRLTSLRWNLQGGPKFFLQSTLTYSQYQYRNGALFEELIEDPMSEEELEDTYEFVQFSTKITDWAFHSDASLTPSPRHSIRFGLGFTAHRFSPQIAYIEGDIEDFGESGVALTDFENSTNSPIIYALAGHLYAQDDFQLGENWRVNAGLRLSSFLTEFRSYGNIEPRLSLRYQLRPRWQLQSGVSRMVQYLHRVSPAGLTKPDDIWIPSDQSLAPQTAWQGDVGFTYGSPKEWELSIEVYGKWMENLLSFDDSTTVVDIASDLAEELFEGTGRAFGFELLLRREFRRTGGQLGYNLAWADRHFDGLNLDNSFPFIYDRRHQVSLFLFHQFSDRFEISLSWLYGTGQPVIALSEDLTTGFSRIPVDPNGQRNETRNSLYHRLDLSARYQIQGPNFQHQFKLGLYNSYNRINEALQRPLNNSNELMSVSFLPLLPSFSYSLSF